MQFFVFGLLYNEGGFKKVSLVHYLRIMNIRYSSGFGVYIRRNTMIAILAIFMITAFWSILLLNNDLVILFFRVLFIINIGASSINSFVFSLCLYGLMKILVILVYQFYKLNVNNSEVQMESFWD